MKDILQEQLANRITELKSRNFHGQKILNLTKEALHIIVLNYLYSHKTYKNCVMFGGSALRLVYDLPRMSIDLDFQVNFPLDKEQFKEEIIDYFKNQYGYKALGVNLRSSQERETDVFWITFSGLDNLRMPNINYTKLKIRLDLNKFETSKFQHMLVPIKSEDYHFYLKTYPLSTLMASKIAALLNRVQYSVPNEGKSLLANYKGRDVYDLIWYVQKGIIPNLSYLAQKGLVYSDYPSLFKEIKKRLSNLDDEGKALKADLTHLYLDPDELDQWINNWKQYFLGGLQNYSFAKIERLENILVTQDFDTDHFIIKYYFRTHDGGEVVYRIDMSELFVLDFPLSGFKRNDIKAQIDSKMRTKDKKRSLEYVGLFYSKIEAFLKQINHISPKVQMRTKFIQCSYEGYGPNTTIVFTDKELQTCQFDDLL
jgi:hypothetical protein